MGCPYNYRRYRRRNQKMNKFPAELAELKMPKGSEFKEVKKGQINIPYYFRDTEWRF